MVEAVFDWVALVVSFLVLVLSLVWLLVFLGGVDVGWCWCWSCHGWWGAVASTCIRYCRSNSHSGLRVLFFTHHECRLFLFPSLTFGFVLHARAHVSETNEWASELVCGRVEIETLCLHALGT